jgi:hypothetical protein
MINIKYLQVIIDSGLELGYTEFSIKVIEGETPQDIRKAMEDYIPIDLDE